MLVKWSMCSLGITVQSPLLAPRKFMRAIASSSCQITLASESPATMRQNTQLDAVIVISGLG